MVCEVVGLKDIFENLEVTRTSSTQNGFVIVGKIKEENAIIVVSQPAITLENVLNMTKETTNCVCTLKNDVFSCFDLQATGLYNFRLIYPASEDKVKKYTTSLNEYKKEGYEEYKKVLEVKLKQQESNNWIRNIINGCEKEENEFEVKKPKICEEKENKSQDIENQTANEKAEEYIKNPEQEKLVNEVAEDATMTKEEDVTINKKEDVKCCEENGNNESKQDQENVVKSEKEENKQNTTALNDSATKENVKNVVKKEYKETIFYNDKEFVIIPNYKWNQKSIEKLYLICLFKSPELYSIRELTDYEILERAKMAIHETIKRVYNFEPNDVYIFFHYHPTYYSLHLHICNVNFFGPCSSVGRAVLIDNVIENLKISSDFYKTHDMHMICRK